MKFSARFLFLCAFVCLLFPRSSPAPLIYQPGEGWTYQGAAEIMDNPKDQLELGTQHEEKKAWDDAIASYLYILRKWPHSEQAQEAQYRIGVCRENIGMYYNAFLSYQRCLTRWPSHPRFDEILDREYQIGNLFLAGQRQRIWRIRTFPSMDKAVEIYQALIRHGPQSKYAPMAQFNIGLAREKQKAYEEAVASYQKLIDLYPESDLVQSAYYRIGAAYARSANRADYDRSAANKAVEGFDEYLARYPKGSLVEDARNELAKLHAEQARGIYDIARFYEKQGEPKAALIYFNDLIARFPNSSYSAVAKERVERATRAKVD